MDFFSPIINSVGSLFQNQFPVVFQLIGILCVFASAVDAVVPDEIDKGFFKELRKAPILGKVVDYFVGMSVLRKHK